MVKTPPKGYRMIEHPLPHDLTYNGVFDILDATKDATLLTVLRATEIAGIEAVEVNPRHASFAEETGPTISMGSIVPRIQFTLRAQCSQAMILDNEFAKVQFHMMPIYTAFLDSLEAADDKTDKDVASILELSAADTTEKRTRPLFSTVNLSAATGTQPVNTILETEVFGDWGLATDLVMESVAWDVGEYFDAVKYFTNGAMLRKVTGPIKTWTLSRDRPAMYHSSNFTNPTVKRGNPWTYCGVMLWTSQVGVHSFGYAGDFDAADKDTVHFNAAIRFDEWNPEFDQTVV